MRFAIASQNRRTVTGHAGMTRRFLLLEADAPGDEPREVGRLDLPREQAFHNFHGDGPHPVDGVDVMIVGSCGAGFEQRLARRGIRVVQTSEPDPAQAVRDFLAGTVKPPEPHEHGHHHHHHHHGHHHPEGEGPQDAG